MYRFLLKRRAFEHETSMFLLVNLVDFFMTYRMLMQRSEDSVGFVESNPVARYFLDHWGVKGLLWFKLGIVLLIVFITILIADKRPGTARGLLLAGTVTTAAVVLYSLWLLARHTGLQ
jgi:hypothetical protein